MEVEEVQRQYVETFRFDTSPERRKRSVEPIQDSGRSSLSDYSSLNPW